MSSNNLITRYKCVNVFDNLNIEYISSDLILMWNKYQVFLYGESLECPTKTFIPEYRIHRVLISADLFLCLDTDGFIHVNNLSNVDQQLPHQPKAHGIKACVIFNQDKCLSLQHDSNTYYLCVNKINSDFKELNKVELNADGFWPLPVCVQDKYIIAHKGVTEASRELLQKLFNIDSLSINSHLIAISFDNQIIYGCIFDDSYKDGHKIDLVKLYACPSEICNIEIVENETCYMAIALKMGTMVMLSLVDVDNSSDAFPSNVIIKDVYLTAGLHKYIFTNGTLIHTDGLTMWRVDNFYTKDIQFKQCFLKYVKDFILQGDNIICTTFSKMIYKFPLDAETSYLSTDVKEYNSAEDVLKNTDYLKKIFLEVEKSNELVKQQTMEGTYIAAMSLAKREELMEQVISISVTVCDSLEEVLQEEGEELTLPEDLSRYIEPYVYLFIVKIKFEQQAPDGLSNMVSDIIAHSNTEIHITISNQDTKILKTISAQVCKLNFLIPHHLDNDTEINLKVRIISRLPGLYNKKQKIWTEVYRKEFKLTPEHFIRTGYHKSLFCMKGWVEDFDKAVLQATNMSRNEFTFVNAAAPYVAHTMYLRFPHTFKTSDFTNYFGKMKAQFMIDMLGMDEFLSSKKEIRFLVGRQAVEMEFENDGFTTPRLKIVSGSLKVTASIRNFLSDIIYGDNACNPGEQFINLSFYTTVENLQKEVKKCIENSVSFTKFEPLKEKFEGDIIGSLPV